MSRFNVVEGVFYAPALMLRRPLSTLWLIIWSVALFAVPIAILTATGLVEQTNAAMEAAGESTEAWPYVLGFVASVILVLLLLSGAWMRFLVREEVAPIIPFRLGPDEVRLLGLGLWSMVASIFLILLPMLVVSLIAMPFGLILTPAGNGMPAPEMVAVFLACAVFLFGYLFYLNVRLLPAAAATIAERKIRLFSAWKYTKGIFWPVLGGLLLIMGVILGFQLIASIVQGVAFYATMAASGDIISGHEPGLVADWSQIGASEIIGLIVFALTVLLFTVMQLLVPGFAAYIARWYAAKVTEDAAASDVTSV